MTDQHRVDVAVIGAGPAGLSAATVLGRQRRTTLLLDSENYRNAASPAAHMVLGQDGTAPKTIREQARATIAELPSVEYRIATVTDAEVAEDDDAVVLTLADGTSIVARRVILATGQVDDLDVVDGLRAAHGTYSFHCPYCHGWEARDTDILVAALPHTMALRAAYQALYLRDRISERVRLLAPAQEIPAAQRDALAALGVELIDAIATDISGGPGATVVRDSSGAQHEAETLFAVPPTAPGSEIAQWLGAETLGPCVVVDQHGRTTVAQVFAAGDGAVPRNEPEPLTFVAQAGAEGQRAALWADQDLFMGRPEIPLPEGL
ncbi:NAD(P)/FAD-dependent oxidoreductase [Corynebacterium sp. TAE3-ERU12]|uniref:NAD(P)/FAD-dependent oxidoreductase n=1 Tax=Corynebacterium sp. TAE3-ERU12 TaxID=2849491 RepID=UPI001C4569AB|nr:NAD(P)/FAD-dependent oxidoreductase [Corynebacterium sp. TAE3-ERU12]MBV7295173.1 NAD(P)/FAD-dependent oxidoreductase [Corynebacterium sp. TAE3-ERU12]